MRNASIPKRALAVMTTLAKEAKEIAEAALQLQQEVETERVREAQQAVDQH